jgi:hypothetical protein
MNGVLKRCFFIWVFLVAAQYSNAQARTGDDVLLAGAARVDITPDFPVSLDGYSNPENRISEGVHDRLFARAIALRKGSRKLILVSCDLIGFALVPISYFQKGLADKFDLQPGELFLCGTHTHSAPMIYLNKSYPHPNNYKYTESLREKIIEAVSSAMAALQPARIGAGRGSSPVGANRRVPGPGNTGIVMGRNPEGTVDNEVLVLGIEKQDHSPIASLFDYACHSRSLNSENKLISGDIFGIAEQFVERILGEKFPCAAFAGASGDIDPWYVVPGFNQEPGWLPETVLMGNLLGEEVAHVFRRIREWNSGGEIRSLSERVALPGKPAGPVAAVQSDRTKYIEMSAARIGDIAFLGLDCEALVDIGKAIKAASPFKTTFILTHCNGGSGYLPPAPLYNVQGRRL